MGNAASTTNAALLKSPIYNVRRKANKRLLFDLGNLASDDGLPKSTAAEGKYTTWDGLADPSVPRRQLQPDEEYTSILPPIDKVLVLFSRSDAKEVLDARSTLLFPMFSEWLKDSCVRTDWKGEGKQPANDVHFDLHQIYGDTTEQTNILRSNEGGRLRSQLIDGHEYPPFLFMETEVGGDSERSDSYDIDSGLLELKSDFDSLHNIEALEKAMEECTIGHKCHSFAVGTVDGNSSVGKTCLNILFLREHNRVAGRIANENPDWDDERIFQTARNVCIAILLKIVVGDYLYHITDLSVFMDSLSSPAENDHWQKPTPRSIESTILFEWYALLPDKVNFQANTMPKTADKELWNNNRVVTKLGVEQVLRAACQQRAGAMGLRNTPAFALSKQQELLQASRDNRLASFNRYCELYGVPPPETFMDLTQDEDMASRLQGVYESVEDVELLVGLMAQTRRNRGRSLAGTLMTAMIGKDIAQQALSNPLFSHGVYGIDTLTEQGFLAVDTTSYLQELVIRNTDIEDVRAVSFGFDRRGGSYFCN